MPRFVADVAIERPARYGKQLASHLGHKAEVTELENGWSLAIGTGVGLVILSETHLQLVADADDPEMAERIKFVLEKHLKQFATKLELQIDWQ